MPGPHHRAISKRTVDALTADGRDNLYWDRTLPGFGVRVYASGRKTYVVQCRGPHGSRRVTIARHGDITPDQARKQAAAVIDRIKRGEDPVPPPPQPEPLISDLVERFIGAHVDVNCKPSSAVHYRQVLYNHILPALGTMQVRAVERTHVAKLHHALRDRPVAANRTIDILSKMLTLAEAWKMRPAGSNPCRSLRRYKEEKRERFLTAEEIRRLGRALTEAEAKSGASVYAVAAIRLLLLTGCRLNEVLSLRWDDVDRTAREIRIRDGKTGPRSVPLTSTVMDLLAATGPKTRTRTESHAPYSLFGDRPGAIKGEALPPGDYRLQATTYSGRGLTGQALDTLTVSFAVVQQPKPIRLQGGTVNEGRLEIFHDGRWGTVCDDYFYASAVTVACRQLGFSGGHRLTDSLSVSPGSGPIWLDDVNCTGSESALGQCPHSGFGTHNCYHFEDVILSCGPLVEIVTPSTIPVPENRTLVAVLEATVNGPLSGGLSWTIAGGADSDEFTLTAAGVLSFNALNDHGAPDDADGDGSYEVTVRVSGQGTAPVEANLTVTLQAMDGTAPSLSSAAVDLTTLVLTYNELLDIDSSPAPGAFAVTVGVASRSVTGVSVGSTAVSLTLASAVLPGETVTVSYTVPTDAGADRIQDAAGNDAAALASRSVDVPARRR